MTKLEALKEIKALRDKISDVADPDTWVNDVCDHLDAAGDVIEFPKDGSEPVYCT
jgi:hypothetical protein